MATGSASTTGNDEAALLAVHWRVVVIGLFAVATWHLVVPVTYPYTTGSSTRIENCGSPLLMLGNEWTTTDCNTLFGARFVTAFLVAFGACLVIGWFALLRRAAEGDRLEAQRLEHARDNAKQRAELRRQRERIQ